MSSQIGLIDKQAKKETRRQSSRTVEKKVENSGPVVDNRDVKVPEGGVVSDTTEGSQMAREQKIKPQNTAMTEISQPLDIGFWRSPQR